MNLDPTWLFVGLLLVGHVSLFVVVTNVLHASGVSERALDLLNLLLLGALVAISGLMIWHPVVGPWSSWPWILRGYGLTCLATALVGLPLTTLLRHARRLPAGVSGTASEVDLTVVERKEDLIGTGKHAWMLRLPGNESFRLKKVEWEIAIPNLPVEWDGLSLVHLTDLHFSPSFRRRFFEVVADEAAGWDADIVAFTGDLLDHDATHDWIEPVMSRLRGRLGTFAILGNHDLAHDPRKIRQALARAGFADLEGRWVRLEMEGGSLAVGGTSYPWGPTLDHRAMPEADFRLMLSHTPDRFAGAARAGIDLVLSGHNHAGQIRLPLIGPVFMPSLYSRRFDRGFFRSGRSLLYVSQGIAGKHPVRYGDCFPELTRIVLRVARPTIESTHATRAGSADEAIDAVR
jgi:predicted MPP superfamily phosphohydrolase